MSTADHSHLISNLGELPRYAPPDHQGTVNVRMVGKEFCGAFEMNHGTVEPGGEAEPHLHETEHQVFYMLEGECDVTLGDDAPVRCGPGAIVQIPPKLMHRVVAVGDTPMKAIIIYSPPLGPREEVPVD